VVLVVNMAAKHRFPGSRVCKIGRCRICTDYFEADKLEFGVDVAARVDYCARHYDDFRQLAGDSDSDKVNILFHGQTKHRKSDRKSPQNTANQLK